MKRLLGILAALAAVVVIGVGTVQAKPEAKHEFKLPAGAKLMADGSYYLGKKTDPTTGKEVEGIAYLHPTKQSAKVAAAKPGGGTVCYAYITQGLKWKSVENWKLDPANSQGLSADFLLNNTAANIAKWETAAGANIFGNGTLASGLVLDDVTVDGVNEVMFGSIDEANVIAVTMVWGYYSGPAKFREIVEWDQMYDQQDFAWSASGEADKMDYNNISTHEIGHAAGMGHPSSTCTNETMYAYATEGETKKQTLNAGDIAGINALY